MMAQRNVSEATKSASLIGKEEAGEPDESPSPAGSLRAFVWSMLAVLLATGAIYGRSGGFEFTNWDEPTVLLDRERIRSLKNLPSIWTEPEMMDFFPITETSYALEYWFAGYDPQVYHLTNIVLHVACSGVVCWLAWSLGLGAIGAAVAGAAFGLHPMHVETAAWVADRKDLLACLFSLLSILSFLAHGRRGSNKFYVLAVLLGIGAILSKPSAVSLGACVFVLQVGVLRVGFRRALLRSSPLLLAGLAFSALIFGMHQAGGNIQPQSYSHPGKSVLLAIYGFAFHLWKFGWPTPLVPLYDVGDLSWNQPVMWASAATVVAFVVLMWVYRRNAWAMLALGWYATGIAPVLRFVQVGSMVVADRYMYFPSVGFCLLLGLAAAGRSVGKKDGGDRRWGRLARYGIACVVLVWAVLTHLQIGQWRDSETLWRYTIRVQPIGEAYINLGTALSDRKKYESAVEQFRQALALEPEQADWHNNLGNALLHLKRYEEATSAYRDTLRLSPGHYKARVNLCEALMQQKNYAQALATATQGLTYSPDQPALMNMAAWIFATCPVDALRDGNRAVRLALRASELKGGSDPYALDTLAAALAETGDFDGAVKQARRAIEESKAKGDADLASQAGERLKRYEAKQPFRSGE